MSDFVGGVLLGFVAGGLAAGVLAVLAYNLFLKVFNLHVCPDRHEKEDHLVRPPKVV